MLQGEAGGGGAGGDAQLAVDGLEVGIHRVAADEEARGDLGVRQPLGDQPQLCRLVVPFVCSVVDNCG